MYYCLLVLHILNKILFVFQVSWIRHRDIHILTVGAYTYTSDQRFQAIHHRSHSDQWTLHIKWAQKRDAGIYECQVSTQPVRSIFVTLNVVGEYKSHYYIRHSNFKYLQSTYHFFFLHQVVLPIHHNIDVPFTRWNKQHNDGTILLLGFFF